MGDVHLRPATEADLAAIVDVSIAAFDPSTDAIAHRLFPPHLKAVGTPDGEAHRQWSILRKSARLQARNSAVMVAIDESLNDQIVGYAVWFVPVEEEDDSPPPPRRSFAGADQEAFAELRKVIEADEQESFGERGSRDVWNLDSVGVHPGHQRRGIGKILLNWGLQEAAAQGKDCYLVATPAGVPLYRAAGFENVRTVDIFGVPHVSMLRRSLSK